ncbi:TPA: hypothetical protein SMT05_000387 [Pseudomonas aeruginosa]|nr:hypothetical protein [Pseudomonas aeruginosa]HEK2422877.1 hypothetical protein [Pseudomonas aeruginosa]
MTESKICTCPSGDGSLRWPCPAHPAEQAGGGERAAFERAFTVQEGIYFDDKRGEYRSMNLRAIEATDAQDLNLRLQGWQARAALAQPSPVRSSLLINGYQLRAALDFIAPDGTAEQLESEACIEWRQQDADFLEAGLYAFCAEYPEEGGVLLDEEPTNSQPSPAQELAERGTQHRFSTTEQTCRHDFYGVWWNDSGVTKTGRECRHCGFFVADMTEAAAEQAEAERPEVVAYADPVAFATFKERGHEGGVAGREWMWAEPGAALVAMSRTDECERIVGALRAKADQLREALEWRKENQAGQRELLRSVTAERDAALARVAELESKLAELEKQEPVALANRGNQCFWVKWTEAAAGLYGPGIKLYAAPVAQAQRSVPETINEEANSFLRIADAGQFKDNAVAVRTAAVIIRGLLHRPPLMQSIIRHRIGLTPEYEGQWHADLYGEDGEVQHHAEADTPDEAVRAVVALAAAPGNEGV